MNRDDQMAAEQHQLELEQRRRYEDEQLASDPGYSQFLLMVATLNALNHSRTKEKDHEVSSESDC